MLQNTIQVTSFDMNRLFAMIEQLRRNGSPETANLEKLEEELARSNEVEASDLPADVVSMNSRVMLQEMASGQEMTCSLVFPTQANVSENRISILAPLGTAILGYRVGDAIEWPTPGGMRQYKILELPYQPEAAGDFHL